jgi:cytochrome o ubiquinol oxidase subunit III
MKQVEALRHREEFTKTTLGFWIYLMTDCVLFASLFATFAVLRGGTAGGPTGAELFELDFVLTETLLLLVSSLTSGLALIGIRTRSRRMIASMLVATFALGAGFLFMELSEFSKLVAEGHSWQASAFLSAFFTLVGTHGLHIAIGLLWIVVLLQSLLSHGITNTFHKRLALFSMFWHFLDIIWIFIFTIVYLIGALG